MFDDISFTVDVEKIDERYDGRAIVWYGEIVDPDISASELEKLGMAEEQAKAVQSYFSDIKIIATEVIVDEENRQKHEIFHSKFDEKKNQRAKNGVAIDATATFNVWLDVNDQNSITQFDLRPFDQESGYHLLVEVDSSKMYTGEAADAGEEESVRRRREHQDLLRTLGDDPNPNRKAQQGGRQ